MRHGESVSYSRWIPWIACGSIVLFALVAPFDEPLTGWIAGHAPDGTLQRQLFKWSYWVFHWPWPHALLIAAFLLQKDAAVRIAAFATSAAAVLIPVNLLKLLLGRARPQNDLGPLHFQFLSDGKLGFDAFPSGHVANAVLLCTVITLIWPRLGWVVWPLALMTALGRIVQGRHYVTDVIAGFAIAVCITLWVHALIWRQSWAREAAPESTSELATGAPPVA